MRSSGIVAEQVGGCVRIHFLDNVGGALGIQRLDDRFLDSGLDFFQRLGGGFLIQGLENCLALIGREIFHDVGNVGRVQLGQAFVRDLQLHAAGGIGLDKIDKIPGNTARGNSAQQRVQRRLRRHPAQQAADGPARAHIDRVDAQDGGIRIGRALSFGASTIRSTSLTRTTLRPLMSMTC